MLSNKLLSRQLFWLGDKGWNVGTGTQGFNRPVGRKRQNLRRNGGLKEGELS